MIWSQVQDPVRQSLTSVLVRCSRFLTCIRLKFFTALKTNFYGCYFTMLEFMAIQAVWYNWKWRGVEKWHPLSRWASIREVWIWMLLCKKNLKIIFVLLHPSPLLAQRKMLDSRGAHLIGYWLLLLWLPSVWTWGWVLKISSSSIGWNMLIACGEGHLVSCLPCHSHISYVKVISPCVLGWGFQLYLPLGLGRGLLAGGWLKVVWR